MDGWLKWLVAVTCVAVLAAVGWWGRSKWDDAQEQEAARIAAEHEEEVASEFQAARMREACQDQIADWDAGRRQALVDRYGVHASDVVEDCRKLMPFWDSTLGN